MSKGDKNIEELFKDTFENFESDVSPDLWSSLQSQIGQSAGGSGAGASGVSGGSGASSVVTGSAGLLKIAAVVGIAGSMVAGGYYLTTLDQNDIEPVKEPQAKTIVLEEPKEDLKEQKKITIEPESEITTSETTEEPQSVDNSTSINESEVNTASEGTVNSVTSTNDINTADKTDQVGSSEVTPEVSSDNSTNSGNDQALNSSTPHLGGAQLKDDVVPEEREIKQPEASIHASIVKEGIPLRVQFRNNDISSMNMTWSFGDGTGETTEHAPTHTFNQPGEYFVILTVEGEKGYTSRDTMVITASKQLTISIPNVFTPNHDGINDVFMVEVDQAEVESYSCTIMDRNGNPVYESNNVYGHWDGRNQSNADCPQGTYFYIVKIQGRKSEPKIMKGSITLRR